jgi:hypothetical protein
MTLLFNGQASSLFLNHDHGERGLRLVRVGSCTQKTPAIGR